ncbi:MAG: antitoxin FitA [Pseudomonadota bacterium]|jgi:plasmid stability protein|nr:antitoxin FitA [Pseudomonadota bacterium]
MPVNLSVKNVPDALAERLRTRAERNHRSLQRELLSILESAAGEHSPQPFSRATPGGHISIDEVVAQTRKLFPQGTASSVAFIRAMRDGR